ncbi:unnamed protein product [Peniophora sp. CBMAI 1063]|nr:unnamed protein product [Peniophora sp. CBMAI 1063]
MSSPRETRLPGFQDLFGHVPLPTPGSGAARVPRSKARVDRKDSASPVAASAPHPNPRSHEYSRNDQRLHPTAADTTHHRQIDRASTSAHRSHNATASTSAHRPEHSASITSPESPVFSTIFSPRQSPSASRRSSFSSPELLASGIPVGSAPFTPHAGPSNAAYQYRHSYVPLSLSPSPSISPRAVSLTPFDVDAIPRSSPRRPRAPGRGKAAGEPHKTARDNEPPPFNLDPASFTILQNQMWVPRADTPTAMICHWGRCGREISTADGEIPSHLVNAHGLSQQHDASVTCRWVDETTGRICGVAMTYHSARQHVLRHVVRVHRGACRKCRKTMKEKGGMKRHLKMCLKNATVSEMLEFGVVVVLPSPGSDSTQAACIIAPHQAGS